MANNLKMDNFKQMMGNDKQRNIWILGVLIAFVTIIIGFYMATRNKNAGPGAEAQVAGVPQVSSVPGSSDNPAYNKLVVDKNNKDAAKIAADGDKSFVPTITNTNNRNGPSPLDLIDKEAEARKVAAAEERKRLQEEEDAQKLAAIPAPITPPVVSNIAPPIYQPVAQVPVYQPVIQPVVQPPRPRSSFTSDDSAVVSSLVNMWRIKPSKMETDIDKTKTQIGINGISLNNTNAANSTTNIAPDLKNEPAPIKAGVILNAILETGINSDEPSPVLAKIVTGEFKDARLMGQMTKTGEKVIVQFNTLSSPKYPRSINISAVAIDPEYSRTSLASDVDRHYFSRFGLTLGAAFVSGFAEAIGRQNTTTSSNPLGGMTVVQGVLSASDITKSAMGKVGQAISADIAKNAPSGPTITVKSGEAIGILFMTDLIIK